MKLYSKKRKFGFLKIKWAYYLCILVVFCSSVTYAKDPDIVIIGNKTLPFETLDISELIDVFTFKKDYWDEKMPINIVLLRWGDTHRKFTNEYLDMQRGEYNRLCIDLHKKTKSMVPVVFKNENSVLEHIRITKGAIGYISARIIPKGVKTIEITK